MSLINKFKHRNVFRVAIAYIAIGWVVMQFASIVVPTLNLPDWTMAALLIIGVLGFPVALWLAWSYVLTPEGVRPSDDVAHEDSASGVTRRKLNRIIITLLGIALILVLAERLILIQAASLDQPTGSAAQKTEP